MSPKIFITGSTGYIGGDFLFELLKSFPHLASDVTCLVRSSSKGAVVVSVYPSIRLVYGDLDSTELLETESRNADIVLHFANCDHVLSASAIARGLASRPTDRGAGYWIHTSGTGMLGFTDLNNNTCGSPSSKFYSDDDEGVKEVTSIPDNAPHRNVDKIVLAASAANPHVKTAIISPPTIFGQGRGPGNKRSVQLPELSRYILQRKQGFYIGAGLNRWMAIPIQDLSKVYVRLVEEAMKEGGGSATWGAEGYYFAENGIYTWGEISVLVTHSAYKKGLLPSTDIVSVSADESKNIMPGAPAQWGTNSLCKAVRARKVLGWAPSNVKIEDTIDEVVTLEAHALGMDVK